MSSVVRLLDRLWQLPFMLIGYLFTWFGPFLQDVGEMAIFFGTVVRAMFKGPFELGELLVQLYQVGVKSLPIVVIAGLFVGAIVAVQFNYALAQFPGTSGFLGGIATSGLLREVGPVLVSIMVAARIGAYIAAELGTMKVTEQIDAVRCLGADPIQFLVVPRFIAVAVMIFLLTVMGLIVGTVGGAVAAWLLADMGVSYYFQSVVSLNAAWALFNGMAKGVFFGLVIATISCYKGISTTGGTEGVGRAVNSCLVSCAIAIFMFDYMIASVASLTFQVAEEFLEFM
jgi:phospholipid/cholesterol/gamma-HCH transport system permease protein